jgi:hypothetical protein
MLRAWKILHKEEEASRLESWAEALEKRSSEPPRITWELGQQHGSDHHHAPDRFLENDVMS